MTRSSYWKAFSVTGRRESDGEFSHQLLLGLNSHVADASDQIVMDLAAGLHGHHFYRISLVVRAENQVVPGDLHILQGATAIARHGVHVGFAFAIGLE